MITPPMTYWPFDFNKSRVAHLLAGVANDSETEIGMGIMPLLGACATVAQGKFAVGLPRACGVHEEPLCIFGITVAEASERKSSVLDVFMEPILALEEEGLKQYENQVRQFKKNSANAKALLTVLRRRYAHSAANGEETAALEQAIAEAEASIQDMPIPLRLAVQDVRGTAFAREIARQPGTRLTIADGEGGSLEPILKERQLFNFIADGFNGGKASYLRASKPSIDIQKAHVSLSVMMQPEKLKRLTGKSNLWHEGGMARVLSVFTQPRAGQRFGQQLAHDAEIFKWYQAKIRALHLYPWKRNHLGNIVPYVLRVDEQALAHWNTWKNQLEQMQSSTQPTHIFKAWYGKMAGVTARVAALIHLMETNGDPVASPINPFCMDMAIKLIQVLDPHMRVFYEVLCPNPALNAAFHLARWLVCTQASSPVFSLSVAIKNTKLTAIDAHLAAQYLASMGALTPSAVQQDFSGKQPSPQFMPNWHILQQVVTSLAALKA